MKKFWNDHSLTLILLAQFLITWIIQIYSGWMEHIGSGDSGSYLWVWLRTSTENWQSEALQVALFVYLSKHYIHKDSPQSRDGSDEIKAQLNRIEDKVSRRS
jgi:hypothetical protein